MSDSPTPPATSIDPNTPADKTPKRRRRRWPWVFVGLFVAILLLALLAPTIASLGFVRAMVVPSISKSVAPNGKLEIDSWSLGWFSGQKVEGIRLFDDQNAVVAHLNVTTGASLLSLVRGNLDVGDTSVTGDFDARIDPDTGRINLLHILGSEPSATAEQPSSSETKTDSDTSQKRVEPIDIPALRGKVAVVLSGTISSTRPDSKSIPFTKVDSAKLNLDLSNLETGVVFEGLIKADVGGKPTSITLKGSADAIENHRLLLDPDKIAADINTSVERLDLTLVNTILAALGVPDQSVAGLLQGSLAIKLVPGGAATITSGNNLGIDQLIYKGPALKGDTLALKRTDLTINVSRQPQSGVFNIQNTGLKSDLANVLITGSIPQQVIQNLQAQKAPGANGTIKIDTTVPEFAKVAAMLPNTIALKQGTSVTGGGLASTTNIDINPTGVVFTQNARLEASGISEGKPIRLEATTLAAGATLNVRDGQPIDITSIKQLSLDLAAPFASIKGAGVPEKIAFDGKVDLTKLRDSVKQFIELGDVDFSGTLNFALNTQGLPTDQTAPLGAKIAFDTSGLTFAKAGETYLSNEKFDGIVDLFVKQTPESNVITFKQLKIGTESGLVGVWTTGESLWIAMFNNGAIGGEGEVHVRAKLDRLAAMIAKNVDPSMKLSRGTLDSVLQLTSDTTKNEYRINLQSDLTKLDVGEILSNETLKLGVTMFVPDNFAASHTWYEIVSNFAAVKGEADLKLTDPKGGEISPFDRVQKLSFEGQVPSVAKLYGLAQSLIGQSAGSEQSPLPPLKINGGTVAFNGNMIRDAAKQTSTLTLNVPSIDGLSMSRGESRFQLTNPATVNIAASVTNDSTNPAGASRLKEVIISQLDAKFPGIANVTMTKPVQLTNLGADRPDAQGEVAGDANLASLGSVLAVVNGANSIPYSGKATFTQAITSANGRANIVGRAVVSELAPIAKDASPIPLHSIELTNELSADLKAQNLDIRTARIVAPELGTSPLVDVKGSLLDWSVKQELKDVQAAFDLKWESVWSLLEPMVDPEKSLAVTLNGDYRNVWKASGKLSDLSTLNASGELAFKTFNAAGLNLTQKGPLNIPILVKDGEARFTSADGKEMADVTVNDGTMKLAGIELKMADMTLSAPRKHQLLRNVQINAVLANQLGKYASVLFAKSSKATGTLDVKIEKMQDLPIADLAHMNDTQNAKVAFSVRDLYLDGFVPKALEAIADLGTDGMRAEIRDASLNIAGGRLRNDVTFTILRLESTRDKEGKPREVRYDLPLSALGSIDLGTLKLVDSKINLPTALIKSTELQKYLGDSIVIPVTGFANAPQLKPEKILEEIVKQNLRDPSKILGGLLGDQGSSRNGTDGKQSDLEKAGDLLGGLLGGSKKQDEPKTEPAANEDPPKKKKK